MEMNMIRNHIRYRRALRWHDGSVDAIVFRPAEGIIVTGSEDRFMKVKYNVEIQVLEHFEFYIWRCGRLRIGRRMWETQRWQSWTRWGSTPSTSTSLSSRTTLFTRAAGMWTSLSTSIPMRELRRSQRSGGRLADLLQRDKPRLKERLAEDGDEKENGAPNYLNNDTIIFYTYR